MGIYSWGICRLLNRYTIGNHIIWEYAVNSPILDYKHARDIGKNNRKNHVLVKCPRCWKPRWMQVCNYNRVPNSVCVSCNRKVGNKAKQAIRLAKIKSLLVCPKCGGRVFQETDISWDCLCGRPIYKDRVRLHKVKLVNLVKV